MHCILPERVKHREKRYFSEGLNYHPGNKTWNKSVNFDLIPLSRREMAREGNFLLLKRSLSKIETALLWPKFWVGARFDYIGESGKLI